MWAFAVSVCLKYPTFYLLHQQLSSKSWAFEATSGCYASPTGSGILSPSNGSENGNSYKATPAVCQVPRWRLGAPVLCLNALWYGWHGAGVLCIFVVGPAYTYGGMRRVFPLNNETVNAESHQGGWRDLEIILTIHG